jgi:hypothetical protein
MGGPQYEKSIPVIIAGNWVEYGSELMMEGAGQVELALGMGPDTANMKDIRAKSVLPGNCLEGIRGNQRLKVQHSNSWRATASRIRSAAAVATTRAPS